MLETIYETLDFTEAKEVCNYLGQAKIFYSVSKKSK